jgi:predicted  nucleic acid-binding Zn-ribbon protein
MEELKSLEDLLELQLEDIEIDRLLRRRETLDELESYRETHSRLTDLQARAGTVEKRLREADLAADKGEGELTLIEQKLEREERRLYAGGLSARDAEHLRSEVGMLRRQAGEREEEVLSLIDAKEEAQAELEELQGAAAEAQAEKDRLDGIIKAEWKEIDAAIAAHEVKKVEIVPLIPAELLALYEELRPSKEGVAVGRLAEGICGGCHLRLSAAERAQAMKETPPRCYHCRRILVPQ